MDVINFEIKGDTLIIRFRVKPLEYEMLREFFEKHDLEKTVEIDDDEIRVSTWELELIFKRRVI